VRQRAEVETVAFVLCIERNAMRPQALLLIESIRAFAGAHRNAQIWAVAPRPRLGVDDETRARLDALDATYVEEPLNLACPDYGSANRLYAAAWVARRATATTLVVLDSDTLLLDEPELLGPRTDVAARPVDMKGCATTGPGDPFEPYWESLCALAGESIDVLPFLETTIDRRRVRAAYNGGYSVVRRDTGILESAADLFTRSVEADVRPLKGHDGAHVFSSTGFVSMAATEYWGSNQAALAVATWSTTRRVRQLDARYNVPVHALAADAGRSEEWKGIRPIHVHYHFMLYAEHRSQGLEVLTRLGTPPDRLAWIAARTPLDGSHVTWR
jgi:hypothetical protein